MSTPTAVPTPTRQPPRLSPKLITGEELAAMGDIGPSELVKGKVKYHQVRSASYLDVAPELVVEVMSPDNTWSEVQKKLAEYFAIGVLMIWVVDPQLAQIHVYRSPEQVKLLRKQETLAGEDVLPGFAVALTEIFAAE